MEAKKRKSENETKQVIFTPEEGYQEALHRIARCKADQSEELDLGGLYLRELPKEVLQLEWLKTLWLGRSIHLRGRSTLTYEMQRHPSLRNAIKILPARFGDVFPQLKKLDLGSTPLSSLTGLESLKALTSLDCSGTQISDLAPIKDLTALTELNCWATQISDLAPIKDLTALTALDCSFTQISDLADIKGLTALTTLDCSNTRIKDLADIKNLTALTALDCSGNRIKDLADIKNLTALTALHCSFTQISDLADIKSLTALTALHCSNTQIKDLADIKNLTALTELNCSFTQISDLADIKGLTALTELDCSGTRIPDLAPIKGLTALTALDCSRTQISDLADIKDLTELTALYCRGTQISDLAPIKGLTALTELNCSFTRISDLADIKGLTALTALDCSGTQIKDLAPIKDLTALTALHCSDTQISDLADIKDLTALTVLYCRGTQIKDLAPIKDLTALTELYCSFTQISDLADIKGLTALTSLDCSDTQIKDLADIKDLTALTSLHCSDTQIKDLADIKDLTTLTLLNCSGTQIKDLADIKGLTALTELDCSDTQIKDLADIKGLTALTSLDCSDTQIKDLADIKDLTALTSLDCRSTQISDLADIKSLTALTSLDCSDTEIKDLSPLLGLDALSSLTANHCKLDHFPPELWNKETLEEVNLFKSRVKGIPNEVLSKDEYSDNCLPALRAHLADLGDEPEYLNDVKLMVLGNGRVGKTQLIRALLNKDYQPDSISTHGVMVTNVPMQIGEKDEDISVNIWDFGGQDIYHATHALFFRTRAIFLICWHPDFENEERIEEDGVLYQNQKLPYWLNHVLQFAGEQAPIIVAQTRCDGTDDEEDVPEEARGKLKRFEGFKRDNLKTSAAKRHGFASLNEALSRAYADFNPPLIGSGRAKVKQQLEQRRAQLERKRRTCKEAFTEEEKALQTMSVEEFERACSETGQISNPKLFLQFLHNAGTVFYQENLLNNDIIIDQNWALDAIYSVFNRDTCVQLLSHPTHKGHFCRADIGHALWDESFSKSEQYLFLSMMESCGICFKHYDRSVGQEDGPEQISYIAPEFLADEPDHKVRALWQKIDLSKSESEENTHGEVREVFYISLSSKTLIRGIISEFGSQAGLNGDYWSTGVQLYDANSGCFALIEQINGVEKPTSETEETTEPESSECSAIVVRVKSVNGPVPKADTLLQFLVKTIEKQANRFGVDLKTGTTNKQTRLKETEEENEMKTDFAARPPNEKHYYVSYAWADDHTPEGKKREEKVDEICNIYRDEKDIHIHRDKTDLKIGSDILQFMERLGKSDRVFVFLSDKYLKSPNCMYELFSLWQNARMDADDFSKRVRIFKLDDVDIWSDSGRLSYALYWKSQFEELKQLVQEVGYENVSSQTQKQLRNMQDFAQRVDDILVAYSRKIQPRTFEEFLHFGFDENGEGEPAEEEEKRED